MMAQGLRHFSDIPLIVTGMLIFVFVFAIVIARILTARKNLQNMARMPLNEESEHE
jgi:hypothetical protein